ncbi:MAG: LysR family transcriptional regulator [Hyphomicrobiales bacterium]|nr:LysR family transcriptional regulator [Hyphomicrobiales bacterium]
MDWDKLRVFYAAAEAGSFTHAGDALGLSQSAVSRQVGALESDLDTPLFHRHARGLILTEPGEILLRTVKEVMGKLEAARLRLGEQRDKPQGELRITTTLGLGTNWLTPQLGAFMELYPDVRIHVILSDDELDLGMREADVALRLRAPSQPDLVRRRLFTVHYHLYASPDYIKRHGQPRTLSDLDGHRLLAYGVANANFLNTLNSLLTAGRDPKNPRSPALVVNNITALRKAVDAGVGVAILPEYLIQADSTLVRLLPSADMPELECYLVYPEEMKNVARVQVFRDFLVSNAQRWKY